MIQFMQVLGSRFILWLVLLGVFGQPIVVLGQTNNGINEGVILVDVIYKADRWSGKVQTILPCFSQSKASQQVNNASLVSAIGEDGKTYYERSFLSPRVVQVERGMKNPGLLKELDFVLKVPFRKGVNKVEFRESMFSNKPDITLDLKEHAQKYLNAGGFKQEASCKFSKLADRKLENVKPSFNKKADRRNAFLGLRRMLDTNPKIVLELAKNSGISLNDVRKYIDSLDSATLNEAGFTSEDVERYIKKLESLE